MVPIYSLVMMMILGSMIVSSCRRSGVAVVVHAFQGPSILSHQQRLQKSRRLTTTAAAAIVGTKPTSFDDGQRPFQITTPIYYVNDKPHIGHAYTSIGEFEFTGAV